MCRIGPPRVSGAGRSAPGRANKALAHTTLVSVSHGPEVFVLDAEVLVVTPGRPAIVVHFEPEAVNHALDEVDDDTIHIEEE